MRNFAKVKKFTHIGGLWPKVMAVIAYSNLYNTTSLTSCRVNIDRWWFLSISEAPRYHLEPPKIDSFDAEGLQLSWKPMSPHPRIRRADPPKYTIEMREAPQADWRPVAAGIPDTSFRLAGLRPEQDYTFRVRAEMSRLPEPVTLMTPAVSLLRGGGKAVIVGIIIIHGTRVQIQLPLLPPRAYVGRSCSRWGVFSGHYFFYSHKSDGHLPLSVAWKNNIEVNQWLLNHWDRY